MLEVRLFCSVLFCSVLFCSVLFSSYWTWRSEYSINASEHCLRCVYSGCAYLLLVSESTYLALSGHVDVLRRLHGWLRPANVIPVDAWRGKEGMEGRREGGARGGRMRKG